MRWTRGTRSSSIEDRRGASGSVGGGFGGGRLSLPGGRGAKIGIPGLLLLVLGVLINGGLGGGGGFDIPAGFDQLPPVEAAPAGGGLAGGPDPDAELVDFVSFVLDDVQATWDEQFRLSGRTYEPTGLVLYERGTPTAGCGYGEAAAGPFYCPADRKVYLDLAFFRELRSRFGAPGDYAQAYVLAHEIGHHVQNLLGTSGEVRELQAEQPDAGNELSVRLELQADCLAGVWGHSTYQRDLLESGDLQEGLTAAAAVGDDTLQRQSGRGVNPESWTHGSSEQRQTWFTRGFDSGDPGTCDTFAGDV